MDKIDFTTHEEYELGDTHLSYEQIADETGYAVATVSNHCISGPLQSCQRVEYHNPNGGGACVAVEYDGTLHEYLQTQRPPVPTDTLAEMVQYMAPVEIAAEIDISREAVYRRLQDAGVEMRKWGYRIMREKTYTRQLRAQQLYDKGHDVYGVAAIMGMAAPTIEKYLNSHYDKPAPIEGRTPLWEQDPSEHGLW